MEGVGIAQDGAWCWSVPVFGWVSPATDPVTCSNRRRTPASAQVRATSQGLNSVACDLCKYETNHKTFTAGIPNSDADADSGSGWDAVRGTDDRNSAEHDDGTCSEDQAGGGTKSLMQMIFSFSYHL